MRRRESFFIATGLGAAASLAAILAIALSTGQGHRPVSLVAPARPHIVGLTAARKSAAAPPGSEDAIPPAKLKEKIVPFEGQTLMASTGTWNGTPPLTYTYQWQQCNSMGLSCTNIALATHASYTVVSGDVGNTLVVVVTATNSYGSASKPSVATGVVTMTGSTLAITVNNSTGQFNDGSGNPVRLIGVNVSGTEDACVLNEGFAWNPLNSTTAGIIAGAWHSNVVRVPLNEDCWLGINGSPSMWSGAVYRAQIESWVAAINAAGMYAILDLHWAAPGSILATQQWPMANADHSVTFWASVATAFESNPAVLFELFNEPYIGGYGANSSGQWSCWLSGCSNSDGPSTFTTAGVQAMVTAIRGTGATQVILLNGLSWAGVGCGTSTNPAVCEEMSNLPTDPDSQLALAIHSYGGGADGSSYCDNTTCLGVIAAAAALNHLPVTGDEIGDTTGADTWNNTFMNWADAHDVGYLMWAWTPGTSFWDLVSNNAGTCRTMGCNFQRHFALVNP